MDKCERLSVTLNSPAAFRYNGFMQIIHQSPPTLAIRQTINRAGLPKRAPIAFDNR